MCIRVLKNFLKLASILALSIAIGYIALVLAYSLPTGKIHQHISRSYSNISNVEFLIPNREETHIDNFTDSISLLEAEYDNTNSAWVESLLNPRLTSLDENGQIIPPATVFLSYHTDGNLNYQRADYPRYWHGYLIFLKPLLFFLDYGQIKTLMATTQILLVAASLMVTARKFGYVYAIPLCMTYLFLSPLTIAMSAQYNRVFLITWIQMLVIPLCADRYKRSTLLWVYHFFIVGILVAYFDYLTFPLVAFGVPFVFASLLCVNKFSTVLKRLVTAGFAWCCGYAGMWVSKWALGTLITGIDVFANAQGAANFESGTVNGTEQFNYLDVIIRELHARPAFLLFCLLAVVLTYIFVRYATHSSHQSAELALAACIFAISAAMPIVWYCVFSAHTWIHSMEYRELAIFVCGCGSIVALLLKRNPTTHENLRPRLPWNHS